MWLVAVACRKRVVHLFLIHHLLHTEHAHGVRRARPRLTCRISDRNRLVPLRRVITSVSGLVRVDVDVVIVTEFIEARSLAEPLL